MKNIVFDLGGVLVELDLERSKQGFRELGMERVAGLLDAYHPAGMVAELEKGAISFHEACEQMRRLTGRTEISDECIAQTYTSMIAGVPVEKMRMVEALRRRGLRTYVLSNNNPASMEVIRRLFTADGKRMEAYFDRLYISYEMHLLKPSEAIFRAMTTDSGMLPDETLFIDDSQTNVEAAARLGFAVYKPEPHEDFSHLFEEFPGWRNTD